eukprot:2700383-Rhodomonas_salina.1
MGTHGTKGGQESPVSAYARATRCPVLSERMVLPEGWYAVFVPQGHRGATGSLPSPCRLPYRVSQLCAYAYSHTAPSTEPERVCIPIPVLICAYPHTNASTAIPMPVLTCAYAATSESNPEALQSLRTLQAEARTVARLSDPVNLKDDPAGVGTFVT